MPEKFTNFGLTTLASNIDSSVTTITVASGANLPLLDFFIAIDSEVIYVATRSGNSLTGCLRGQKTAYGGAAASHTAGASVYHGGLAHHLDELYSMSEPNVSARAIKTATQSVTAGVGGVVTWNTTASFDTDTMWTPATNRFTIRRDGKYLIVAKVEWAAAGSGRRILGIQKNGSTELGRDDRVFGDATNAMSQQTTVVASLVAGDTIEVSYYSSANTSIAATVASGNSVMNEFAIAMLSGGAQPNTPGARVRRNAASSLAHNTDAAVAFDTLIKDTEGLWSAGQSTRLTIKTTGWYTITGSIAYAANATGARQATITVNGIGRQLAANTIPSVGTAFPTEVNVSAVYYLLAGDYLELFGYQNSGVSLALSVINERAPFLAASMIPGGLSNSSAPRGVLGYVERFALQTGIGVGPTDLTSMTLTVNVTAGRRLKISAQQRIQKNTTSDWVQIRIAEGGTVLQTSTMYAPSGTLNTHTPSVVVTPTAGSHTYKLQGGCGSGTFDAQSFSGSEPAFLLVEDIGSV